MVVMRQQRYKGQEVSLDSSQGRIRRVVVAVVGDVVLVCRDEERARAAREGREPVAVGFRLTDVLD
jgi:hypothetical protein